MKRQVEQIEQLPRVHAFGSVYRIEHGPYGYSVLADGVAISGPGSLEAAHQALEAVTQ